MHRTTSPTLRRHAVTRILGVLAIACMAAGSKPAAAATFQDDFAGMTLKPVWNVTTASPGATVTVNNGLQIATPSTSPFDYWTGVGNAPNVTIPAPSGDFTFSALLQPVVDSTGAPVESMNYHAALIVNFGGTDDFFWGAYTSNAHLRLERSGVNAIADNTEGGTPVWLQIQKSGTSYHFFWKQNATDPWTELTNADGTPAVQSVTKAPVSIGMMLKTWSGVDAIATFNSFSVQGASLRFPGTIAGKVATNGPSASKVGVQATSTITGVVSTSAVAADGTFSLSVAPGPYSVDVIGSSLSSPVAPITVTVQSSQTSTANFTAQIFPDLNPTTDQVFDDQFKGTTLNPQWQTVFPLAGPTVTVNNGLQFNLPATSAYDYWVGVGNAPQIHLPAPNGDFIESAKINSITDGMGNPLEMINYHTALQVFFGGTDSLMFGAYRSNGHLQVERSGTGNIAGVDITGTPVWIQIQKTGNNYTFAYKEKDTDPWTPLAGTGGNPFVLSISQQPQAVGLMQKTWQAVQLVSSIAEYRLEAASLRQYGTISGKITGTGNSASLATVQAVDGNGNVVATSPVAADGAYKLEAGAGSYTVSVVGPEVIEPQAAASQSGINVVGGGNVAANFTVALYPPLNSMTDQVFTDSFMGTTLNSKWETIFPQPGPTITANNGAVFTLPGTAAFDYWTGVANSPQLALPGPTGDFIMSGKVQGVNDPTGAPIEGMNYHAALYVNLGGTDSIFWGVYRSNSHLQLERSGTGNIGGVDVTGTPLSLQITQTGGTYSFQYKEADTDPWTDLVDANGNKVTITAAAPAQLVGILQKQWAAFPSVTIWSSFRLEGPKLNAFGSITGKITTSATDMSVLTVQVMDANGNVLQSVPVASDGTYKATLLSGAYAVRVIDDTPSVRATNNSVTVPANQATTVNFDLTSGTTGATLCGDLLGTGKIGVGDATLALRISIGLATASAANLKGACGHPITVGLATQILRAVLFGTVITPKA